MNTEKRKSRTEFFDSIIEASNSLAKILDAYENLDQDDNSATSENFPFLMSYDEWLYEYANWVTTVYKNFFPNQVRYSPTITVGELKKILNDLSDDIQIVISNNRDSWWTNIDSVIYPDDDEGIFTLCLNPGREFESRQL